MSDPCRFCKAECCISYIITATAFDILRIIERTGKKPEEFAMLHQARLLAFDPDTTLDMADDGWVYILGLKSHPCVFLEPKTNRCAVHACSPMACRRFPYQLDGKLNTRFCPLPSQLLFRLIGPDIDTKQMVCELEAHKRIVKEWNKKPGKNKDCLDFLLKHASGAAVSEVTNVINP